MQKSVLNKQGKFGVKILWRYTDMAIFVLRCFILTHPVVCTWMTWTSLKPRDLPVQRLSRYALVIHSYHMSKPAEVFSLSMSSILCYTALTLT